METKDITEVIDDLKKVDGFLQFVYDMYLYLDAGCIEWTDEKVRFIDIIEKALED